MVFPVEARTQILLRFAFPFDLRSFVAVAVAIPVILFSFQQIQRHFHWQWLFHDAIFPPNNREIAAKAAEQMVLVMGCFSFIRAIEENASTVECIQFD